MAISLDQFAFCPVCGNGKSQGHDSGCGFVQLFRDAQRYRKLKALHTMSDLSEWKNLWKSNALNSAVDALPDTNENPNRSR